MQLSWSLPTSILMALIAATLLASSASALNSEVDPGPDGWAGLTFGTNVEALVATFPEAEQILDSGVRLDADVPRLQDYRVTGQSILGLAPCDVTYRFAGNLLYNISFDCRKAPGDARGIIEQHFGEAGMTGQGITYWIGTESAVSLRDGVNVFGFSHNVLTEVIQQKLQAELVRQNAIAAAQAAEKAQGQ